MRGPFKPVKRRPNSILRLPDGGVGCCQRLAMYWRDAKAY